MFATFAQRSVALVCVLLRRTFVHDAECQLVAIAGLNMARIAEKDRPLFGDIVAVHQAQQAINATPGLRDFGLKRAGVRVFGRALKAKLRGDSGAPFFDKTGKISVTPRVLTLEERRAAEPT